MQNKMRGNSKKFDPPSNILLIIITQLPPQVPLTNESLNQIFSPYGIVQKILIFERGKVNKAFVEFQDIKQATFARLRLNLSFLYKQLGKMHIHFSKLKNLDLQVVENTRGFDVQSQHYHNEIMHETSYTTTSPPETIQIARNRGQMKDEPLQYSKTDEPQTLNTQLRELRLGEFSLKDIINETSPTDIHYSSELGEELNHDMMQSVQKLLDDDYQSIKEADSRKSFTSSERQGSPSLGNVKKNSTDQYRDIRNDEINNLLDDEIGTPEVKPTMSPSPIISKMITQVKSNIIIVSGLRSSLINLHVIYNMFSSFGNISQVIYKNNEQSALLTYQNEEFATVAKECMNNMIFFENRLRVMFCQNQEKNQGKSIQEVLLIPDNYYNFVGLNNINCPSKMLKISNFQTSNMKSLIQHIQKVANVEITNIQSYDQEKNSFLVTTNKIEDSFKIVSYLNNSQVNGIKVQASFVSFYE